MSKVFEDYFSEMHADMVDICMEYVDYNADKIYIYCSCEAMTIHADYFYKIDGQIVERYKVNMVSHRNNATSENEATCLDILGHDVLKLEKLCIEHKRPMPTEIKMIYDVKKNSLDAKYKYDNQWYDDETRTSDDILAEWIEEVKNSEQ